MYGRCLKVLNGVFDVCLDRALNTNTASEQTTHTCILFAIKPHMSLMISCFAREFLAEKERAHHTIGEDTRRGEQARKTATHKHTYIAGLMFVDSGCTN